MTQNPSVALITDPRLFADLADIAAATGNQLDRFTDAAAIDQRWTSAPLILLDPDGAAECAARTLPRRPGIVVITDDPDAPGLWPRALQANAGHVVTLPAAAPWLAAILAAPPTTPPPPMQPTSPQPEEDPR